MLKPIGLNDVFDWIHSGEQRTAMKQRVARHRSGALKVAAAGALLVAGVWGISGALGAMRDRAEQRELERLGLLERAGAEYRDGNHEAVITLLSGAPLPDKHPRATEWDTLYVFAASNLGRRMRGGDAQADSLLTLTRIRVNRALQNAGLYKPETVARLRFVRATVCEFLQCGGNVMEQDLNWILENSKDRGLRRRARQALEESV